MNFYERAKIKFDIGAAEHGDWSDIDPYEEIKDEILDIYNYFNHPKVSEEHRLVGQKFALFLDAMIDEAVEK